MIVVGQTTAPRLGALSVENVCTYIATHYAALLLLTLRLPSAKHDDRPTVAETIQPPSNALTIYYNNTLGCAVRTHSPNTCAYVHVTSTHSAFAKKTHMVVGLARGGSK